MANVISILISLLKLKIMKKAFNILTILLIISTCFQNLLNLPYIGRKIQLTEFIFLLFVFVFPYKSLKKIKLTKSEKYTAGILIIYILSNIISAILSKNIYSMIEVAGRLYLICLFIILITFFNQFSVDEMKKKIPGLFFFMGWFLSVFSLLGYALLIFNIETPLLSHYIEYPYLGTIYRLQGPTFTPTMLITILTCCLLLSLPGFQNLPYNKMLRNILFGIIILSTILTFSKTILIIFWGLGLWLINQSKKLNKFILWAPSLFLIILTIISTHFIFLKSGSGQYEKYKDRQFFTDRLLFTMGKTEVYETSYLSLKRIALEAGQSHFIFGVGPGLFNDEVEKRKVSGEASANMLSYDPHSTYLGAFAETGIFGFLALMAFLLFTYLPFTSIQKMKTDPFYFALYLLLTAFLIEAISTDIMNFRHYWILMAIVYVYKHKTLTQSYSLSGAGLPT